MRRTLVVADVHLTRHTPLEVSRDLASLVDAHRGARLFVAGDLFDRSAEGEPLPSFDEVLTIHAGLRQALGAHLDAGGELRLAAGNHDSEVAAPGFVTELAEAIGVSSASRARLTATPWFFREGGLHVEHGHVFDPDNAPAHPLVQGAPSLGVRFVHDFIAPTGAYAYLNRNAKLPLELFVEAFTRYGLRGPYVVATFFRAAFAALAASGSRYDLDGERATGDALLEAFAVSAGVSPSDVRAVLSEADPPTLSDTRKTFGRLYLDRVASTLSLLGSLGLAGAGKARAALVLGALGAGSMLASWMTSYDRYAGKVVARLADGAELIARHTSAELVVFGHAHHAEVRGSYANPGSFAFSPDEGRTFLEIDSRGGRPRAELRSMPKGDRDPRTR